MTQCTQTPLGDEALTLLTSLMAAQHGQAQLDQMMIYRALARLVSLARDLREAELFRDEAVRFASAEAIATERRSRLHLAVDNVTPLRRPVASRPAAPQLGDWG